MSAPGAKSTKCELSHEWLASAFYDRMNHTGRTIIVNLRERFHFMKVVNQKFTQIFRCLRRKKTDSHNIGSNRETLKCDVLLFVATSTEKDKLESVSKELGLTFTRRNGSAFKYYDLGNVGSFRVMAVKTEMGPFSYDGSATRVLTAKSEVQATALIALGMAFGISRNSQRLGDVIVSKILLPYDNRRVHSEDGMAKTDYSYVAAHSAKESLIRILSGHAETPAWENRVSFGAVLTGGARIHCAAYRDELVQNLSHHGEQVIGGEMEGAGLLASSPVGSPIWILVKGISDFADENRDAEIDEGRPLACENAARFLLSALLEFNPDFSMETSSLANS